MKTLTGVIALMLVLQFGASSVVVAAEQPKPATAAPAQERKAGEKPPEYKLLTGSVTGVDPTTKTFTIGTEGESYVFTFQKIPFPYKVGDTIQLWAQVPAVSPKGSPAVMGTTIPHCASGDPLKGLDVHKSSSSAKGPGPGCVPF
ncbi:MAG TPA: hypothetical protein VI566_04745 [Xanthomonadales bacterium]|nr:hypothetical protein [Xanthomonadales bacterium]